ncbi:MAG: stage II sporulation protein M [Candidatus Thermoplasmatota archaeon]|nr:stage II sporulation protein M [Candidatus Thermoplasmatota archaeon]
MSKDSFLFKKGELQLRKLFLLMFLLEISIFIVISSIPLKDAALYNEFKQQQSSIITLPLLPMIFSIFPHNLEVASLELIPILGQFFYILSAVTTSLILAVEGTANGTLGLVYFLSLALLPDTWIELPSYAVTTSTGIYFLYLLVKKRSLLRSKSKKILLNYVFAAAELLIAATFESEAIIMETTYASPYNFFGPLLLWLPAIAVIIFLVFIYRKINKDEYSHYGIEAEPAMMVQ